MGEDFDRKLNEAEQINKAFRDVSDMLNGVVSTLIGEGWSEHQAREIVVAQWLSSLRSLWGQS